MSHVKSVEVPQLLRYPFEKTSFFPKLSLTDILEMGFQIGYYMKINPKFDEMEFFELVWLYERLASQRKEENERQRNSQGSTSMGNMFGGF